MNDASNPDPTNPDCPSCGSEHTAVIENPTAEYDYWCRDCGEEFNDEGGRRVVTP
jgi:transposase-like protein